MIMLHSAFNMRSIQVPPNLCIYANLWVKVKLVDRCALVHKRFIVGTAYKIADPRHSFVFNCPGGVL